MLATGNPHIKEKMDLDNQVQKLRLLKSSFLSEKYLSAPVCFDTFWRCPEIQVPFRITSRLD
jgi:hypothetical protein